MSTDGCRRQFYASRWLSPFRKKMCQIDTGEVKVSSPMRLQFKVGQCVSSVIENVNQRTDEEIVVWVRESAARAQAAIREAAKASRDKRASR